MAAAGVLAQGFFLFTLFVLGLNSVCSSGTLVGFSYDSREQITASLSAHGAQFKILVANQGGDYSGSVSSTNISVNIFIRDSKLNKLLQSKSSVTSWLAGHLIDIPPGFSIDSIIVSSNGKALPSLLSTLLLARASQNTFTAMKILVMFSLSSLETLHRTHRKGLHSWVQTLKSWESPVMVEALVGGGVLSLSSGIHSTIKMAFSACNYLPYPDVPIILIVKISVSTSQEEIAEFSHNMLKFLRNDALLRRRIAKLFIDISHLEQGVVFPSLRRELIPATKTTMHDVFNPVTNPVTAPITIPSTNPAPAVVTVPSTNPVTVVPTNPTMSPITIPPMNPVGTPITIPGADPSSTPLTPVVPVTNPATTPTAFPTNPPLTNPVTTYPFSPPGSTPAMIPPVTVPSTVPSTVPLTPAVPGQTWCIAKTGVTDAALQLALDYACGIGGADCSMIQPSGSCYSPDSLQSHASYAFNSYYQKNPVATSCDFGGAAMLVNVNPSTGTCIYPSSASSMSSSIPAYNPSSTNGGSSMPGSGSSVLNSNSPTSSNTVFGSQSSLAGSLGEGLPLSISSTCLVLVLTVGFFFRCNVQ